MAELPENPIERVKLFARDLAQGVLDGRWGAEMRVNNKGDGLRGWTNLDGQRHLNEYLTSWGVQHPPTDHLMLSFGYFKETRVHGVGDVSYVLTQKAFDLLDAPIFASVFISYRRSISSAFALLLHDRLRTEGFDPFIDLQSINPGEKWEDRLRREIGEVDAFVSVMSTGTLESSNVRNEIIWALEREGQEGNFPVIPVWHGGYDPAKDITIYPKLASFLNENNAIIVAKEDVLSYDNAVRQLIQFLKTRP